MKNNFDNLYNNKRPGELVEEEIANLVLQMAIYAHSTCSTINQFQAPEDTAQDVLTYSYEKSARGKIGIKELQEKCSTMSHFKNTLFREVYNSINYKLRKNTYKNMAYNTDSIETPIDENRTIGDVLEDNSPMVHKYFEDMDSFFNKIDNNFDKSLIIKYEKSPKIKFSYKNLMKLSYDLSDKNRLSATSFQNTIYHADTGESLTTKELRKVLMGFRQYLKDNKIFGGI